MPLVAANGVPSQAGVGSAATPKPRNSQESLTAMHAPFSVRSNPIRLFLWLKNVWYIAWMPVVVLVALWSISANPPSPLSAESQAPLAGVWASVPLSCVPPIIRTPSVGWDDTLWNCSVFRPVVFLLTHAVAATAVSGRFQTPPSLTNHTVVGTVSGSIAKPCESACRPTLWVTNVVPPSSERFRTEEQVPLAFPPMYTTEALFGSRPIGLS